MRKYMWPNSCLPSATALISAANAGSHGRFTLEGVENHAARGSDLMPCYSLTDPSVMTRLPSNPPYLGTSASRQLKTRCDCPDMACLAGRVRVRYLQKEVGIFLCLCGRGFPERLHHLSHADIHSRGEFPVHCHFTLI